MAIDPGNKRLVFYHKYRSVTRYRVRVGLSVHEYVFLLAMITDSLAGHTLVACETRLRSFGWVWSTKVGVVNKKIRACKVF